MVGAGVGGLGVLPGVAVAGRGVMVGCTTGVGLKRAAGVASATARRVALTGICGKSASTESRITNSVPAVVARIKMPVTLSHTIHIGVGRAARGRASAALDGGLGGAATRREAAASRSSYSCRLAG